MAFSHILDLLVIYEKYVLLVLIVLFLFLLTAFIGISVRMSRQIGYYRTMLTGMEGKNLEEMLYACFEQAKGATNNVQEYSLAVQEIRDRLKICTQKLAIVRFNAFEDIGGEMSFALAVLDQNNNGYILSNIYARQESHVYVRPIEQGKSNFHLLPEEEKALEQAKSK